MPAAAQLTFVPGEPIPAGGAFAVWVLGSDDPAAVLAATADLGLPAGDPGVLRSVEVADGALRAVDRSAQLLPVLTVVRRLAVLPPGADLPPWSRPSASVLAWSVAAKLALELTAAGRLVPGLVPGRGVHEGLAVWRAAAGPDPRPQRLADAMPVTAHALRRPGDGLWGAAELVEAFLDAVADACAREGRRPELDPRRRAPRGPWQEMWVHALAGSDPTVEHLRVPVEDLVRSLDDWAAPLLGREAPEAARLGLRLSPPPAGDAAGDAAAGEAAWRVTFLLRSTTDPTSTIEAAAIWARPGAPVELAGGRVVDPDAVLARGLATAARLFPPIDRALSEARPTGIDLDAGAVSDLLTDGVGALAAAGVDVDVPPELRDATARRLRLRARIGRSGPTPPRIEGRSPLGLDALTELTFELAIGDEAVSEETLASLVSARQPLVRWRGSWVLVDLEEADRLAELAGHSATIGFTEALAAALSGNHDLDDVGPVEAVADGSVAELVERLRGADRPGQATIVGLQGRLRPYQERGVAWLQRLTELGIGGVLADDMGLGKTVQAIALLAARSQDRPHLVVCPTSVVGNWERELARFAPDLPVIRHHGTDRATSRRAFRAGHVVVTSYALLRRDLAVLEDVAWDIVVLDEAQQIKNPSSKGARAARALDARARIAMTGTPIENRLSELWAVVDVTNPGLLGSQRAFNERFAVPIERWHDQVAAARLRRLTAPFLLRRRKGDPEVAVDLPPKQEITVACALTREQASLYRSVVDETFRDGGLGTTVFERRGRILALLTALKQICNHPAHYLGEPGTRGDPAARLTGRSGKLARATEILAELVDAGEHALVFTQFRRMGELLVSHLRRALDLPDVPFLHGGVALPARDAMVRRFQEDEDAAPILLVSLRAGGSGLTLTRANHVLHFDRWWNPAVEDQATDRVHRIGQHAPVTVHTLVTAGTVEERIAELLDRKRALADAVVGAGEAWITELDDDELHDLVALSTADLADEDEDVDEPDGTSPEPGRPSLVLLPGGEEAGP